MFKKNFKGIFPVLSVPFDNEKNIDYASLRNLINFCIEKDVNGIVMFGVASEFYKITDEESIRVIETIIEEVKERLPVIIGVGRLSTYTTLIQAKYCEKVGVSGIIIFPPYFIPLGRDQLFKHYSDIAGAVDIPVIIQDAPQVSGVSMDVEFFINLNRKCKNIVYAKIEAPLAGPKISKVLLETKGKFSIFDGWGGIHFYEHLLRGVCGLMPGCSIVDVLVDIYHKFTESKKEEAYSIYKEVLPLINLQSQSAEFYIVCEKAILKQRGVIKYDILREPCLYLDITMKDFLMTILSKIIKE